jgi:tetratricopeptide (TPR) repeat protein
MKDSDRAAAEFQRALSLAPPRDLKLRSAAEELQRTLQREKGQVQQAIKHFDEAIRCDPASIGGLRGRAECYLRIAEWGAAIEDYKRALALKPDDATALGGMSAALRGMGELDKSLSYLEKAIRAQPGNPWHYVDRGKTHQALDDSTRALSCSGVAARAKSSDVPSEPLGRTTTQRLPPPKSESSTKSNPSACV